jgi:hypothetical protein
VYDQARADPVGVPARLARRRERSGAPAGTGYAPYSTTPEALAGLADDAARLESSRWAPGALDVVAATSATRFRRAAGPLLVASPTAVAPIRRSAPVVPAEATDVIRRKLPGHAQYAALDPTDAQLQAVATAVQAYNALAKPKNPGAYQASINALQGVDRSIYAWFGRVSAAHQELSGNPHSAAIQQLADTSEKEHAKLIDASKNMATVLPFDPAGLLPAEVTAMQNLWQDVVNSRGKLKVLGSSKYKQRVRAELAKILSTPTGRRMLQFLNTAPGGEVAGSAQAELTATYIGEKVKSLPAGVRAASPDLENRTRSEAQVLGVDQADPTRTLEALTQARPMGAAPLGPPNPAYAAAGAGNLTPIRDAAWGGQSGFDAGGQRYGFSGTPTGAFVTSFPGEARHPAKAGVGGGGASNEIITPGWVTMAHELGHAANFKAGATTLKLHGLLDELTATPNPMDTWDNPEELINIENVENAVRGEAGITERLGHRPPQWLIQRGVQLKAALRQPLYQLTNSDPRWTEVPEWVAFTGKVGRLSAKQVVEQQGPLQTERDAFLAKWTPAKFNKWKRDHPPHP